MSMAAPARFSLASALGAAPAESRGTPWKAQASGAPTAASPVASSPRSARSGCATPRRLLLAETLAMDSPARDLAAPAAPSEPPMRLSIFASLLALEGPPAMGDQPMLDGRSTGSVSGSPRAELALLGPPPGLPAPPGLEEFQVKADVERTCSAFSDGWSSESTAAGSARISEQDFASRSPEPPASAPFGRALEPPLAQGEAEPFNPLLAALFEPCAQAEPFNPLLAALFGAPPTPADFVDTIEPAAHDPALCRPCAWFWKPVGCKMGAGCGYCHVCPDGALKDRKKVKCSGLQAEKAAMPQAQKHQISLATLL